MIDALLNDLIGKPWVANARGPDAYDCYHLVVHVEQQFNRFMPPMEVPNEPTWRFILNEIERHPSRRLWRQIPNQFSATDGAIVLMGANSARRFAHLGVWLSSHQRILHVDKPDGVTFETVMNLKMKGWQQLAWYDYVGP